MLIAIARYVYALCRAPFDVSLLVYQLCLFAVPARRPSPRWSFSQAAKVRISRVVVMYWSILSLNDETPLEAGKEGKRFVVAKPASDDMYRGPLDDTAIRPTDVGMTWTKEAPIAEQCQVIKAPVVLHFHGGAFAIGTGRDNDTGALARNLIRNMGCSRVCAIQYRLSSNPLGYFPAALQDCLTVYLYLQRELKIPAEKIILSGDSAGGSLVVGLLRYIHEYGRELNLEPPAAALLWSPWVDLYDALATRATSKRNYKTDYISTEFGQWGAVTYTNHYKIDARHPYISPGHHPFTPWFRTVPIFVQTGELEVPNGQIVAFAQDYRRASWDVGLTVSKDCPHDIMMAAKLLGFAKEAVEAAREAKKFLLETTSLHLND